MARIDVPISCKGATSDGNLGNGCNLKTFNSEDAGTDDEIYIGFWGTAWRTGIPIVIDKS